MCSHYQAAKEAARVARYFGALGMPTYGPADRWPRRNGLFVRRPPELESGDEAVPEREAVAGRWGLVLWTARGDGFTKAEELSTFNARSETAATSYTYRDAWSHGKRCIIPTEAIYEPAWRSGKERRMVVILPDGAYEDWLTAPVERTRKFLLPYPAQRLMATPVPKDQAKPSRLPS